MPESLPDTPNLEWLRKQAKRALVEIRKSNPSALLAEAQFEIARQYGFASWRALKAHIQGLTLEGRAVAYARDGDVAALSELLRDNPDLLHLRAKPYGFSLLHHAARHATVLSLLLARGMDPNTLEDGDRTYAMHWAAAAGRLDSVRVLSDAGGDVIGHGDDHELDVIGWATCWEGGDDSAHREVADFLVSRGARHHIFSAIALNDEDLVRAIVAAQPAALSRRMSRNEDYQLPLHFAVRVSKPAMVALLIELGADPLGTDNSGNSAAAYATSPTIDLVVMRAVRVMTASEIDSARRGRRIPDVRLLDLLAALALGELDGAGVIIDASPSAMNGALHIMAKRGDDRAIRWLLDNGADANAIWSHWNADLTPLHLAILAGHPLTADLLLHAGARTDIADSAHKGDAMDWAQFFNRHDIAAMIASARES